MRKGFACPYSETISKEIIKNILIYQLVMTKLLQ